jgi:hypothetical protein
VAAVDEDDLVQPAFGVNSIRKEFESSSQRIARPAQVQIQQSRAQKPLRFCVDPAEDLKRPSAHAGKNRQRSSRPLSNPRKLTTLGRKADKPGLHPEQPDARACRPDQSSQSVQEITPTRRRRSYKRSPAKRKGLGDKAQD